MRWSPGSTAELTSTFTDEFGNLIDPDHINVDLYGPTGMKVDDGTPERVSQGLYVYRYPLPSNATTGLWRIEWQAIVEGLNSFGDEFFEVATSGGVVTPTPSLNEMRLRSRLDERKAEGSEIGAETFFTDFEIGDLLAYAGMDLDKATLEGWLRKQARYARLVDVSESGSNREMSQKFDHATKMVEFWSRLLGSRAEIEAASLAGRIVGRAVNLRERGNPLSVLTPFSGYADHIRMYPTHRLIIPAIL